MIQLEIFIFIFIWVELIFFMTIGNALFLIKHKFYFNKKISKTFLKSPL